MEPTTLPLVIQGGMGIGVSNWTLAQAVASAGYMGVVSGTCMDSLLIRRLQDGDPGEHLRRAIARFPMPDVGSEVLRKYFLEDGRAGAPYKLLSMYRQAVSAARDQVTVLANFVEVHLAKEGHEGEVGINLLTKVQMPNLASLYGAMLAGVDYVLMGAGIPKEIPGVLDAFAEGRPASMALDVEGLGRGEKEMLTFDPRDHWKGEPPKLKRPRFLPIISADSLARMLLKKSTGKIDGFIIEAPTAGGHNAPPRGQTVYNERGEPQYGERDEVNLAAMRELGLPFWLAGGSGSPEGLESALEQGAAGIQVGTLFAYADESGIDRELKDKVLQQALSGEIDVVTDGRASPTGFPFKVVQLEGTNAKRKPYEARTRVCDLGYLRTAFKREDGRVDYRCPAEPVDTYVKKGGRVEDTVGRKCLCNALMADIGHGQFQKDGQTERPLLTSGDDLQNIHRFLDGRDHYSARDVLDFLVSGVLARREDQAELKTA
ncbi:MAG TPA: nitronate monooxygenase [Longimicrobiales bacterium]|nr:nitronate monooxygenase [Longimicrobiales bacterium]